MLCNCNVYNASSRFVQSKCQLYRSCEHSCCHSCEVGGDEIRIDLELIIKKQFVSLVRCICNKFVAVGTHTYIMAILYIIISVKHKYNIK